MLNRERAVDYLNMLDRLYVFDGYAGWDPKASLEGLTALMHVSPVELQCAHLGLILLQMSQPAALCCSASA